MEERVARLEVKVDYLQGEVVAIKAQIAKLEEKLDKFKEMFETKIDALRDTVASLKVSRWIDRVWWLVIAAALLGVMARGFKWI